MMSEEIWVIISFLVFMLLFAGVGMASIRVKRIQPTIIW